MNADTQEPAAYIVQLEPGCWIAPWSGDPGRTAMRENAQRFATPAAAKRALALARRYHPFANARIEPAIAERKRGRPAIGIEPMSGSERTKRWKQKRATASSPDTPASAASDPGTEA